MKPAIALAPLSKSRQVECVARSACLSNSAMGMLLARVSLSDAFGPSLEISKDGRQIYDRLVMRLRQSFVSNPDPTRVRNDGLPLTSKDARYRCAQALAQEIGPVV